MNFLYPYRGSPVERLAGIIGLENHFKLDYNECVFGLPIVELTDDTNTSILVRAKDESPVYIEEQVVQYTRRPISDITAGMLNYIVNFPVTPTTVPEVLAVINDIYKADLTDADFDPTVETVDGVLRLHVAESSLCWEPGSILAFNVIFGQLVDLNTLITETELDGFWPDDGGPDLGRYMKYRNLTGFNPVL